MQSYIYSSWWQVCGVQLSTSRWSLDFQHAALMLSDHSHLNTYKTPAVALFFIFTSCSNLLLKQTCYLLFCTSEHLSCTMSSLDNEEIKGWNGFSLSHQVGKVWRDFYTSVSAPVKNCCRLHKLERHLFTKPKLWLSKFQRKNGLLQYFNYCLD